MKLISMTDFVLEVEKNSYTQTEKYNIIEWQKKCEGFDKIVKYANFLKQPLTLGMFVPCDEYDNIYVDYRVFNNEKGTICVPYEGLFEIKVNEKCRGWRYLNEPQERNEDQRYYDSISYNKAVFEYQKAKEKVIFEDFYLDETYKREKSQLPYLTNGKVSVFLHSDFAIRHQLIEDLVGSDLECTVSF